MSTVQQQQHQCRVPEFESADALNVEMRQLSVRDTRQPAQPILNSNRDTVQPGLISSFNLLSVQHSDNTRRECGSKRSASDLYLAMPPRKRLRVECSFNQ